MSERRVMAAIVTIAFVAAIAGCSDDGSSSDTTPTAVASTTTIAETVPATTSPAATTTASATTVETTAPAPSTTAVPASTAPEPITCTETPIPTGSTNLTSISADIDGDAVDDAVTSYSLDGVPHVHATLAAGTDSDVEVPIGNADSVSIQFMDFDHSIGAAVPPPMAVLGIGAAKAGTAVGTFLTLTPQHCIRVWHNNTTDNTLFTFRVSAEPIYQGLQCDGAAGSINHSLTTAEQNPSGDWDITLQPFGHDFTTVDLHDPQNFTVPDDPDIQHQYGDLTTCGITLFP